MNNLLIHPARKAPDIQKLLSSIGMRLVATDSNIIQLRVEQEKRRIANQSQTPPEAA